MGVNQLRKVQRLFNFVALPVNCREQMSTCIIITSFEEWTAYAGHLKRSNSLLILMLSLFIYFCRCTCSVRSFRCLYCLFFSLFLHGNTLGGVDFFYALNLRRRCIIFVCTLVV